ncbi:MAG: hypothetical protein QM778_19075 [Myxococcales bacterium]
MSRWGKLGSLVLCMGALLGGCLEDPEDSCSSNEKFENKVCVPDTGDGDGDGDDTQADAGSDSGTQGGVDATGFGTVCTKDAECMPNAPYCAIMPGAPNGYCTKQGCTVDNPGAVCPTGWTCFDLSVFDPSLSTMCRKPS